MRLVSLHEHGVFAVDYVEDVAALGGAGAVGVGFDGEDFGAEIEFDEGSGFVDSGLELGETDLAGIAELGG